MIEETVEVVAVEGDTLVLQAQRKSTCQSCSVQKGCGTSVLASTLGKKVTQFRVENTTSAQVGDSLIVGIPEDMLLKGSVAVYVLPLVTLFVAAMVADGLLPLQLSLRDLWVAFSAIAGLVMGLSWCRTLISQQPKESITPVILRKNIGHVKLAP